MSTFLFLFTEHTVSVNPLCAYGHGPCLSSFRNYSILRTELHLIRIAFCSLAKGAHTPLVQFCANSSGSRCTQGGGSAQGPKSFITLPVSSQYTQPESSHCVVQRFSNCPHVLGRAEVGESLNCLSRNIRSTVLLAVPTHMALFFILGARSGEEGRAKECRGMDAERVTERQGQGGRIG